MFKYVYACFCNKKANSSADKSSSIVTVDFLIFQTMENVSKIARTLICEVDGFLLIKSD